MNQVYVMHERSSISNSDFKESRSSKDLRKLEHSIQRLRNSLKNYEDKQEKSPLNIIDMNRIRVVKNNNDYSQQDSF